MNGVKTGSPSPLGASKCIIDGRQGINFALFSANATQIELCLFDKNGVEKRFPMQCGDNQIWHCWIEGVAVGTQYGYRVYLKNDEKSDRTLAHQKSNPQKLMLDPYAKAVVGKPDLSSAAKREWFLLTDERDNAHLAPKAVIIDEDFDWENDERPQTPWPETILYELHVKGFSKLREDLPEEIRGTYQALAHPTMIAYLQDLGVTAVELLPINYYIDEPHLQGKKLHDYWGYNPLAMFAVESRYAVTNNPLNEFKAMVKALHKGGIEVILDVVFNHTAEGEEDYPTFSQRGIDDRSYYWRDEYGNYLHWTGCGNLLNLSGEHTRCWVVDCLKYWVEECHVDGFRFDLATALGRDSPGYNPQAQLFQDIINEPTLKNIKLISEPWDIGPFGYQLGNFPMYFAEWNDRYRDDMCRFWLWKSGELGAFAERFAGSSDLFKRGERRPHTTVNFITAHDGFTLRDLVSYNNKHNEANGEWNRDGRNENYSYNHGIEGDSHTLEPEYQSAVEKSRIFSSKALLNSLLLSNGTPMLLAGDEFANTQFGNNNVYCQDNQISWLKWNEFNQEVYNNVKQTIAWRKKIQSLINDQWWTDANVRWLTVNAEQMNNNDWHNRDIKAMQVMLDEQWLLLINAKAELQVFSLPEGKWMMPEGIYSNNQIWEKTIEVADLSLCLLQNIS